MTAMKSCAHAVESVAELVARFRERPSAILDYLDTLEARCGEREPSVLALVPEPDGFSRLRRRAEALIEKHPSPPDALFLFGVPVAVKDVFHADDFLTRAGSAIPPGELWPVDASGLPSSPEASSITALRRAGALVMAKAACTELAYFGPGPTRNPHDLGHTPGGSSSGSAAAVAAGLSPLTVGTQTIGSVGRPASYCGVVGFKPSQGRVPTDGVIPLAPVADHVGWFAGDVEGVALAARASIDDWRSRAEGAGERPKLGVPVGAYLDRAEGPTRTAFEGWLGQLEMVGCELREVPVMDDFAAIEERHRLLVAADAWRAHRQRFEAHGPTFHPKTRELLERGRAADPAAVRAATESQLELRRRLHGALDAAGIDLFVAPSAPGPAPAGLDSTGDPVMNLPWTHAGLPALTVPAGTVEGLPVGLQLIGRFGADEEVLAWGPASRLVLAMEASP